MKAAVRSIYGLPGDLSIKELDIPVPKEDEILIRVHATTVNRSDCHVLSGKPFAMRLFTGLLKPKEAIIGTDFAGEVEAAGSAVQSFKTGDKIMGFGSVFSCGSHAQYFILTEAKAKKISVPIPPDILYEEAAACLEGSVYAAIQVMALQPKPGQKALVYGATGAIGTAYLQFLKYYGVQTTAVCRGKDRELVTSLGADKVVDYTTGDFTNDPERYDFIFDAVGKTSFFKCKKLLKKNGIFTSSGGAINLLLVIVTPLLRGKKVIFSFGVNTKTALTFIADLVAKGHFRAVIDRKYPLDQVADAYRYVASGEKVGNVVIAMDT